MIELRGRTVLKQVEPVIGESILKLALKNKVDWSSSCTRGSCARCRCFVSEGMEHLSEANEAEWARLEPEEIEEGYRLACQTSVRTAGTVKIRLKTYF